MSARKSSDSNKSANASWTSIDAAAFDLLRMLEIDEAKKARAEVLDLSQARAVLRGLGLMKGGGS